MKKNLFKIIKYTGILLFVLTIWNPGTASAQSLGLTLGNNTNIVLNQTFQVTVTTSNNKPGVVINLQTLDAQKSAPISWVTVSPFIQQCTTGANGSCVFNLTPKQVGSFHLAASVPAGGYQPVSTGSPIVVPGTLVISSNPAIPKLGQTSIILVQTSDNQPNVPITFSGPGATSLAPQTCSTNIGGGCSVIFSASTAGPTTITATAPNYQNATLNLSVSHCTIQSATFSPSGAQATNWFKDSAPPMVKLDVVGSNCAGETVKVSIVAHIVPLDLNIPEYDNVSITFPSTNTFSINFLAGETRCGGAYNPDCDYHIDISGTATGTFTSKGKPGGNLSYDCDGGALGCANNWVLLQQGTLTPTPPPGAITPTGTYKFLAPLPDPNAPGNTPLTTIQVDNATSLATYLNLIIKLIIGFAAVLAMVMIVMGGIGYMTSELAHTKEQAKKRITNAILGLLAALGAWLLLYTINPVLVNTQVNIPQVTVAYVGSPESTTPFVPMSKTSLQALGITCPGSGGKTALTSIAQTFINKVTYSMNQRNTITGTTAYFDCSSFVSQVYACAGLSSPGNTTLQIFNRAHPPIGLPIDLSVDLVGTSTAINGRSLQPGDLVGWQAGNGGKLWGHVMMYIGNGMVIDAQGPAGLVNQQVQTRTLASMRSALRYVVWAP